MQITWYYLAQKVYCKMKLVIIDYKAGNTQSLWYVLKNIGIEAIISNNIETISSADAVILPGVGHAKAAMENLQATGVDKIIRNLQQPFLGVCVGLQLMCKHSEEGDVKGLGIFDTNIVKFNATGGKVPHMGWNTIEDTKTELFNSIIPNQHVYYVHSYYPQLCVATIATTNYIQPFSAALSNKNFYACQFHPEKSGKIGQQLLKNFLALCK
jgi:imidazole glycerol-phosphate synthase subunit HisH